MRIRGKLSSRQAFSQPQQLDCLELHRETASFRRKSGSSGKTRQVLMMVCPVPFFSFFELHVSAIREHDTGAFY
jgi:hypothetical protein